MNLEQVDIFGETQPPLIEPPSYMVQAPKASQPRLFEPQMEGQLGLEDSDDS